MATRLGVDVGGTFTDLIFYDDETGEIHVGKEPTTPDAPETGVLAAIAASIPAERLSAARYFLHGTTVGLNSLLTRTGAVVGLLCTRGFRDVLEMARGDRGDPYDLFWRQPAPLVPRRLRLPVTERVRANREIWTPLVEEDVAAALDLFRSEGVTSVAVSLHECLRESGARAGRGRGSAETRLRRRDLAVAPRLGRIPGVRADVHDRDRRLRAPADDQLPAAPRGEAPARPGSTARRSSPAPAAAQ